jgi:hypothetical protein
MSLPGFTAEKSLDRTTISYRLVDIGTVAHNLVTLQSCSFWETISCASTVVACAAVCAFGSNDCAKCFADLGRSSCRDCL